MSRILEADWLNYDSTEKFDLTAAFDTVDHDLLMLRLARQFVFAVSFGLVPICVTGPLELFLAATVHLCFTCFALYHKVQF